MNLFLMPNRGHYYAACAFFSTTDTAALGEICTLYKNCYNLAVYEARTPRFRMVVDLDNNHGLYHAIPYHTIPYHTKPYQTEPRVS